MKQRILGLVLVAMLLIAMVAGPGRAALGDIFTLVDSTGTEVFNINSSGNVSMTGTLAVTGATTWTGAATFNGNITANDSSADTLLLGHANDTVTIAGDTSITDSQWSVSAAGVASFAATTATDLNSTGVVNLSTAGALTIASGSVTATETFHVIDTEGAGATDDLDTISGGVQGDIIIIRAANGARDVVIKDGTGNIQCGGDRTLDNVQDTIKLIFDGSNWLELSFANNGA